MIDSRYSVTRDGRIFGPRGERKLQIQGNGYHGISYRDKNGQMRVMYLHKILGETYIPNPENKPCVNHIDGDKLNNALENLEWATKSEDGLHAYRTGLRASASQAHRLRDRLGRFM